MSEIKIEPTCRYGHGLLVAATNEPEPDLAKDWFGFLGVTLDGTITNAGGGYVFRAYKCQKCSYMELHDLPQIEFETAVKAHLKERILQKKQSLEASLQAVSEEEKKLESSNGI